MILGSILLNFVSQFLAGVYVGQGFDSGKQPSVKFHMNSWKKLRDKAQDNPLTRLTELYT